MTLDGGSISPFIGDRNAEVVVSKIVQLKLSMACTLKRFSREESN